MSKIKYPPAAKDRSNYLMWARHLQIGSFGAISDPEVPWDLKKIRTHAVWDS